MDFIDLSNGREEEGNDSHDDLDDGGNHDLKSTRKKKKNECVYLIHVSTLSSGLHTSFSLFSKTLVRGESSPLYIK